MKKMVLTVAIVFISMFACLGFAACSGSSDDILGTWAIAFRFVDEEGNYKYEEPNDEYVVFGKKTFTYYKQGNVEIESSIKYKYTAGQTNKEIQGSTELSLNSVCSTDFCSFTLDKYSDAEENFRVKFYGSNCMTFRYEGGNRILAVLVKCENIGDSLSGTDTSCINGSWIFDSDKFDGSNMLSKYTASVSENGCLKLASEWKDSSNVSIGQLKTSKKRTLYIYVYAEEDYIVELEAVEYELAYSENIVISDSAQIYFRNNG